MHESLVKADKNGLLSLTPMDTSNLLGKCFEPHASKLNILYAAVLSKHFLRFRHHFVHGQCRHSRIGRSLLIFFFLPRHRPLQNSQTCSGTYISQVAVYPIGDLHFAHGDEQETLLREVDEVPSPLHQVAYFGDFSRSEGLGVGNHIAQLEEVAEHLT